MPRFSDRVGATAPPKTLIVGDISQELRAVLWNLYLRSIRHYTDREGGFNTVWEVFAEIVATDVTKTPFDTIRSHQRFLSDTCLKGPWHDAYNVLELFVHQIGPQVLKLHPQRLLEAINEILQSEMSGYRFIGGALAPITNPNEIDEIQQARSAAEALALPGVQEHLDEALRKLAQKPQPDFRNSIKESISAVEATARHLATGDTAKLSHALRALEDKTELHGALKQAFLNLYGYASDEDGIRHPIMEQTTVGLPEANFMLVACSAFVHYLILKAQEAELL